MTRSNNTQNRIDSRDFVALDRQQERIRNELHLEGITYAYKSGEMIHSKEQGFEIEEATVARACSLNDVLYAVQAKGKISKLWNDIDKAPYKALFNGSVTGPSLWRVVQILRVINQELDREKPERKKNNEHLYLVHGNLFIAHVIFRLTPEDLIKRLGVLTENDLKTIKKTTKRCLDDVISAVNTLFPDVYTGNLFKNLKKCRDLLDLVVNPLSQPSK